MVKGLWGIEWYQHASGATTPKEQLESVRVYNQTKIYKDSNFIFKGFWVFGRLLLTAACLLLSPVVVAKAVQEYWQPHVQMPSPSISAECKFSGFPFRKCGPSADCIYSEGACVPRS
mmetsp:Transcript_14099/g.30618  ORF Transcript_14099/g.30618 Transcript_14099/m.30618 type:complete len:117 (-) Transcript_14099:464-814(-)